MRRDSAQGLLALLLLIVFLATLSPALMLGWVVGMFVDGLFRTAANEALEEEESEDDPPDEEERPGWFLLDVLPLSGLAAWAVLFVCQTLHVSDFFTGFAIGLTPLFRISQVFPRWRPG
jgi:hypothetical protein